MVFYTFFTAWVLDYPFWYFVQELSNMGRDLGPQINKQWAIQRIYACSSWYWSQLFQIHVGIYFKAVWGFHVLADEVIEDQVVNLSSVKNDSIRDATELVTAYDLI